ncbi:ABC transporter ATP-binding protein [Thermorudis peleae]|uniref:ABC transporter ATP-binding protein n=1 Tax=Thermorudis peleae TaxID=1382356 RepID=UPI00056FC189|nr:ABC transporter ATP-binding protein [Thermorudis peleae]
MEKSILRVEDLRVYYETPEGVVHAVDGVTFHLREGERLGIVGESGSGKSTVALALLRLIKPPGKVVGGRVYLDSVDLLDLNEEEMRRLRLSQLALIPQGAMNALNPVLKVRDQLLLPLHDHGVQLTKAEADSLVRDLLQRVGLPSQVAELYPHELSGGMKQRVCIAIAIAMNPKVIIADEPTSALDVVVQWQIMDTLRQLQQTLGAAVIVIGHDMGLMAQTVDRIGVMYAGKLVELAPTAELLRHPLHPYTQLLIASLPSLDKRGEFQGIPGLPPSLLSPPPGCRFHPRCPKAFDRCSAEEPTLREVRPDHYVACHLW